MSESAPAWFAEMVLPAWRDDAAVSISPDREPDPIEIDPRPCGFCCLTINRHLRVDTPEGPEFFCPDLSPDEMTLPELERRAELRRQEDVAAILRRFDAVDCSEVPAAEPPTYRTAASTVEAFRFVASLGDPERLKAWLLNHPEDTPTLLKLLETT